MTARAVRRQHLLYTIRLWMRRQGVYFILAAFLSTALPLSAAEAKMDSYAELVKIVEQEKASKSKAAAPVKKDVKTSEEAPKKVGKKAEKKDEKEKTVLKTVAGSLMFIRKNRMAVEFMNDGTTAEDLVLSVDPKFKLNGIKDMKKMGGGDQVSVKYVETYTEAEKAGDPPIVLSRVATDVTFLKKAQVLPRMPENALVEGM